jgi:putative ABC transport system substrate-binding protein
MPGKAGGINMARFFRGLFLTVFLVLFARGLGFAKIYTIGMITNVQIHVQTMEGFKAGMTALGYVEGRDVEYIYHGVVPGNDEEAIDAEIERILVAGDVDLFLTVANEVSRRVKIAMEGTDMPILIAGSSRPVEEGLLDSLGRPGGNVTGVRVADNFAKTLEWLKMMIPGTKKVMVPYSPDDPVSMYSLVGLDAVAAKLGMELVHSHVNSVGGALDAIERLSKDVDAIYRIPSPPLDLRNNELSRAAIARGLPLVACLPLDEEVLMTFTADLFSAGKQTARLADLIRRGAKPSDLPVETCDAALTVNLKTAEKLGLHIPDDILLSAKTIIR